MGHWGKGGIAEKTVGKHRHETPFTTSTHPPMCRRLCLLFVEFETSFVMLDYPSRSP